MAVRRPKAGNRLGIKWFKCRTGPHHDALFSPSLSVRLFVSALCPTAKPPAYQRAYSQQLEKKKEEKKVLKRNIKV